MTAAPTPIQSPTIAAANMRGRMQCMWCRETFGPAHGFAKRFEFDDEWADPIVVAQHAKIVAHCREKHAKELWP
jgi:hypothetical protein